MQNPLEITTLLAVRSRLALVRQACLHATVNEFEMMGRLALSIEAKAAGAIQGQHSLQAAGRRGADRPVR
jgi:hypothetical protein